MKKKAIEKVPYLKLSKTSRKKDVKYIGVTAIKIIGHEKHLFLEVYKNDKTSMEVPMVRIVLTKKDFGNYIPESEGWTRAKIKNDLYYGDLLWRPTEEPRDTWDNIAKRNILKSADDLERIKKFCKEKVWDGDTRWWEYIYRYQDNIATRARNEASRRKYERRQQALKDRMDHTRKLPEQRIFKRANDVYFRNRHYLYYKKHGNWAQVACSKCGGVTDARWKGGESYESQFQRHIEEPREGRLGTCPMCGARGIYKCQGKVKGSHQKTMHLFLGEKYKEQGMVLRYIEVEKTWRLGTILNGEKEEMHNAHEELSAIEIARTYFEPGKKTQVDFQKSDYCGNNFWDDCNLYGINNIAINEAPILAETWEELKETMFRYSALQEYTESVGKINPIKYLERYQKMPQIEMLVKMGLIGITKALIEGDTGAIANDKARRLDAFLGIRPERVKQLIQTGGDLRILEAMQIEKRMNQTWTKEQIEHLAETHLAFRQVELALKYMTIQKLLNRIEKYAACEYSMNCDHATARIRHIAMIYIDYLSMREEFGFDLNNTVYQHPRNLEEAHGRMVEEQNKEKENKKIQETEEKYPEIRKCYRKLRQEYAYEDENYLIRPARSAGEIVTEGRVLHHCVGGANYLGKHNRGETYILMLRFKEEPEIPYITVEIDGKYPRIIQWYGKADRKPDQANMQKWLDEYLRKLRGMAETAIA